MKTRNVESPYDVAIAGGGIIGASLAWRLAQDNLRVVLFDAGRLGGESSSAGAGMLAPGGEITAEGPFTRLLMRSLSLYPSFVEELTAESGRAIDFCLCGAVEKTEDPSQVAPLLARSLLQQGLGIRSAQISPTEVFYPDDGYVDPVDVVSALRIALERRHVDVREQSPVHAIKMTATGVVMDETPARSAVIAAGAWSSRIAVEGFTLPAAYPVKGHLLGYRLPATTVGPIRRSGHAYIVQRASGFTVVGASQEDAGFDKTVDPRVVEQVRQGGEALLPDLRGMEPEQVWTGLRPGAAEPLFHRLEDTRVWLAYGHLRNGILSAPATAETVAGEIGNVLRLR